MNYFIHTTKNYYRIIKTLLKTSFIAELEFRSNIALKIFNDFIWYSIQISVFEVLYLHTSQISGWSLGKIKVFLGCLFLSDTINMITYHENLEQLSERVRKGELDLILAKPVNSQFMLSMYRLNPSYIFNFFICFSWLIYSLYSELHTISLLIIIKILILVFSSNAIMYSLRFIVAATTVAVGRAENLSQIWYALFRMSLKPDFVYPPWLRYILLFVVPLAFVASVPSHILLGARTDLWLLISVVLSMIFLSLSSLYWRWIIRKYSSASS